MNSLYTILSVQFTIYIYINVVVLCMFVLYIVVVSYEWTTQRFIAKRKYFILAYVLCYGKFSIDTYGDPNNVTMIVATLTQYQSMYIYFQNQICEFVMLVDHDHVCESSMQATLVQHSQSFLRSLIVYLVVGSSQSSANHNARPTGTLFGSSGETIIHGIALSLCSELFGTGSSEQFQLKSSHFCMKDLPITSHT